MSRAGRKRERLFKVAERLCKRLFLIDERRQASYYGRQTIDLIDVTMGQHSSRSSVSRAKRHTRRTSCHPSIAGRHLKAPHIVPSLRLRWLSRPWTSRSGIDRAAVEHLPRDLRCLASRKRGTYNGRFQSNDLVHVRLSCKRDRTRERSAVMAS